MKSNVFSGIGTNMDVDFSVLLGNDLKNVSSAPPISELENNSSGIPIEKEKSEEMVKKDIPVISVETMEEEIKRLKEENLGYSSVKYKESTNSIDDYKLGGKMTYYYQNISRFALTFSSINDPTTFPLAPGDIVDFRDYFETEEEILKNLEIKKYENPLIGPPFIRRLTPAEYLEKLRIKKELLMKKRQEEALRSEMSSPSGSSTKEKISSVVESNVRQLLNYFKTPVEERSKLTYTPTHFQAWLLGAIFTEAEYNWMMVNIKDYDMQKKVMERKKELDLLNQKYNISQF